MANISQSLILGVGTPGTPLQQTVVLTANSSTIDSIVCAANTTNQLTTLAITKANLQLLYMVSDTAMTVKTNSSGSPQETITLTANTPYMWFTGSGITNPLVSNVTALYVTSVLAGTLEVRVLQNQ